MGYYSAVRFKPVWVNINEWVKVVLDHHSSNVSYHGIYCEYLPELQAPLLAVGSTDHYVTDVLRDQ